jgi:hypothetical protein
MIEDEGGKMEAEKYICRQVNSCLTGTPTSAVPNRIGRAEDRELANHAKKSAFFRIFHIFRGLNNLLGEDLGPSSSLAAVPRRVHLWFDCWS